VLFAQLTTNDLRSWFLSSPSIVAAPAGGTLYPIWMSVQVNTTVNGAANANVSVRYTGQSQDLIPGGLTTTSNNAAGGQPRDLASPGLAFTNRAASVAAGLGLSVFVNQDVGIGWVGSCTVNLWYVNA
jgi:hypothetical protein